MKQLAHNTIENKVMRQLTQDKIDLQHQVKVLSQKLETSQSEVKSLREQLVKLQIKSPSKRKAKANAFNILMNAVRTPQNIPSQTIPNKQHSQAKMKGKRKSADQVYQAITNPNPN